MNNLSRLHSALVDALHQRGPDAINHPVTVAEIYQNLIPYRSVRTTLGFALNADYEHALLQLLAGEGGLAEIEPAEAREALRKELQSPNPNTGMFRNYAACDVVVTPGEPSEPSAESHNGSAGAPGSNGSNNGSWESLVAKEDLEEEQDDPAEFARRFAPPARTSAPAPATAAPDAKTPSEPEGPKSPVTNDGDPAKQSQSRDSTCVNCEKPLPLGRQVRFCPHCGHDQTKRTCASCGEELESGWRFCIACGTPAE